ncbi:MAG TPA: hypothetical protein VF430_00895 [Verrucomicrobiae bacterium]|jgi:hypothetical protein
MAAKKKQTPKAIQRSFKPDKYLLDFNKRESATPGISPVAAMGAFDRAAAAFWGLAFFFHLRLIGLTHD